MATLGKAIKNVGQTIFNRTLGRLTGAGISTDSRIVKARAKWSGRSAVSYTHLTLPTIYSV